MSQFGVRSKDCGVLWRRWRSSGGARAGRSTRAGVEWTSSTFDQGGVEAEVPGDVGFADGSETGPFGGTVWLPLTLSSWRGPRGLSFPSVLPPRFKDRGEKSKGS